MAPRLRALAAVALAFALGACKPSIGSVGAVLARDNPSGALFVRDVPFGRAADRAGLLPGDQVLMIDGVYVAELDTTQIHARLRGEVGSTVELTVVRAGTVRRLKVVRDELAPVVPVGRPKP